MRLFDIFKRNKKIDLPGAYRGLVSKADYNFILRIAKQYHYEKGLHIKRIGEGEIVAEINGEEQHRYLDNLVRVLSVQEKSAWKTIIHSHFDKLKDNHAAYNYFLKDFDYAAQFLRVLIKANDFYSGGSAAAFIHRTDFPHTKTFLVLEFEGQFKYLREEDITEWGKPAEELFEIAISNIPGEEVEVKEYKYCDKFPVFIFFSGDFSAASILDLENKAEFAIGSYGSLIAIPSKGTAFAHPIETGDIMELVEKLNPIVDQFHKADPGNITNHFYWYYNGQIEIFPVNQEGTRYFIQLPDDLIKIFRE